MSTQDVENRPTATAARSPAEASTRVGSLHAVIRAAVNQSMQAIAATADLIVPAQCVFCNEPTAAESICEICAEQLAIEYYRCEFCAAPLPSVVPNQDCLRCRGKRWRFAKVLPLAVYSGPLRDLVIDMKLPHASTKRRIIGQHLGAIVSRRIAELESLLPGESLLPRDTGGADADSAGDENASNRQQVAFDVRDANATLRRKYLVLPVPNFWTHRFSGAANTAWELAQSVADATGLKCKSGLIRRIRRTAKQGTLAWSERSANVRGAFQLRRAHLVSGRHIFLVDDVFTSGSTAAEVSKVLMSAGATAVDVVVVARGTGTKDLGAN